MLDEEVTVAGFSLRIVGVTIGNPHCVVFARCADARGAGRARRADRALAHRLGPGLERLPLYPNRTNVQFAQVVDPHTLRIEIWERGAALYAGLGYFILCGRGAAIRTGRCESPVTVQMPGGEMRVEVAPDWSARLTGTVEFVCSGEVVVHRDSPSS